jgi:hypothetical protein
VDDSLFSSSPSTAKLSRMAVEGVSGMSASFVDEDVGRGM